MSKDKEDKEGDYAVGYGKPPKEHQFKPGQTGNLKGRPPKSRWRKSTDKLRLEFIDAMHRNVVVNEKGRTKNMPAIQALYDILLAKALRGDVRTANMLFEIYSGFIYEEEDARVRLMELLHDIEAAEERRLQQDRRK